MNTIKGFRVPENYKLRIQTDEGELEKNPGEQSGGRYGIQEVLEGQVVGWSLEKLDSEETNVSQELHSIFSDISNAGGYPVFVGGFVRDYLAGNVNKDIDIEVYGIEPDKLSKVLSSYGKVDNVGVSFGVTKLTTESGDYDFNFPRRENKAGEGHKEFEIDIDSTMTPEEAASRRDFTFNAMSLDIQGNLLDFYGGLQDLQNKVLRHTSEKFAEDPLRVLRAFQFAGRFDLEIDRKTADMARSLKSEYKTLAKERIWGEWEKWALKSQKPSSGLRVLQRTGWLSLYPEIFNLVGIPQNPEWHPEGDVWTHTLHVVDEAAEIAQRDGLEGEDRVVLLLAALCHDLGKPSTTIQDEGMWKAPGHPQEGVAPTQKFLERIGVPNSIYLRVPPLVKEHMAHLNDITEKSVRRLSVRLLPEKIEMLGKVIEADHSGRPPLPKELPQGAKDMMQMSHNLRVHQGKPEALATGKLLLKLAEEGKIPEKFLQGGPHFADVLHYSYEAQLDGEFEELSGAIDYVVGLLNEYTEEYDKTLFLSGLSKSQKQKLLGKGDPFDKSLDELKQLINSPHEE